MAKAHRRPKVIEVAKTAVLEYVSLADGNKSKAAKMIGLNNSAAITQLLKGNYLLPSLAKLLVKAGKLELPPERHRSAAEFSSQERVNLFRDMLDEMGMSHTQWANDTLNKWIKERGK